MTSDKMIFRQKCYSQEHISKKTLIVMLTEGSKQREWFEALEDDQWSIVSFDSKSREVCVDVQTDNGVNHVSVLLSQLTVNDVP